MIYWNHLLRGYTILIPVYNTTTMVGFDHVFYEQDKKKDENIQCSLKCKL